MFSVQLFLKLAARSQKVPLPAINSVTLKLMQIHGEKPKERLLFNINQPLWIVASGVHFDSQLQN